jgi:hypothetical protein
MANGGWCETREEWQRAEAPLLALDSDLEQFAQTSKILLTRNGDDWPERSLEWTSNNVNCLIQIYLDDLETLTLAFGFCAYQDRDGARYWKSKIIKNDASLSELSIDFGSLLLSAKRQLDLWSSRSEELEFAMKLSPMPKA